MWTRILALAALILAALGNEALAQDGRWLRAETANFIVYGDGSEQQLREIAQSLEDFDTTLRRFTQTTAEPSPNKLHVYVVRGIGALRQARPGIGISVRGFYRSGIEANSAFLIYSDAWGLTRDQILFHEYAHHFMLQYFPHAYPSWYVEGWAEYVSTASFRGREARIGTPSVARAESLRAYGMLPIEHLLARERVQPRDGDMFTERYYAHGWFATMFLLNQPERRRGFERYVQALSRGEDSIGAFAPAFGVTPEQFQQELLTFRRARAPEYSVRLPEAPPQVTITRLPRAADDLLLRVARLRGNIPDGEEATQLAGEIEEIARNFPNDRLAQIATARAAILREQWPRARALLEQILARDANDVEARYLLAAVILRQARAAPEAEQQALTIEARRLLAQNFRIAPDHVATLYTYAYTFAAQHGPMTEAQLNVLSRAHELAPQVSNMRFLLAFELMEAGSFDEAARLLQPLLYAPHAPESALRARQMLDAARERRLPEDKGEPSEETEPEPENEPAEGG